MQQYPPPLSDPRVFASTGLDRLGAVPLRDADPRQVGPFRIVALLGGGGIGRIFLGRDAEGKPGLAAVKVIRPEYADDAQFRLRFEREAAALARVRGEQAAVLLGTGFDGDLLWMATDYIPGLSLTDAVRAHGSLDASATWRLAADLGHAVGAMERVGVVHRDVKPSNVILGADGSRVIDFGISQAADTSAITTTGQQVGTPAYMSPEQVRGLPLSTSSDVFALGSVLAYALTGNAPFGDGTSVDVLHRVAFEPPKEDVLSRVAGIDAELGELISACLDKDAEKRPSPADVVNTALSRQVPAPWSATLSGEIMTRVQVALAVQQLPLPEDAPPPAQDTLMLSARPALAESLTSTPAPVAQPYRTLPTVAQAPGPAPAPHPAVVTPAALAPFPAPAPPQRRRNGWLIGGAVAAVAAIATVTVLLTGSHAQQASAGGANGSGTPTASQGGGVNGVLSPSAAASGASAATASAGPSASASQSAATSASGASSPASAAPSRAAGSGGAPPPNPGTSQGAPAPTSVATTAPPRPTPSPAGPPSWDQACTYYSGNALTQYGDKNSRVTEVQCLLTNRGYGVGSSGVDGQFGPDTRTAVRSFQSAKGLVVDGQVGVNTWAALRSAN